MFFFQNPVSELSSVDQYALDRTVRYCLDLVGLGSKCFLSFLCSLNTRIDFNINCSVAEAYTGVPCQSDLDCDHLSTTCDMGNHICRLPNLSVVEDNYLKCYIDVMPSSLEVLAFRHFFLDSILRSIFFDRITFDLLFFHPLLTLIQRILRNFTMRFELLRLSATVWHSRIRWMFGRERDMLSSLFGFASYDR